ncbi:MAG: AAA family ATPase [Christensenellaceae bacterium]|mgnify:FL=1|nr:AAA family ATPase [Christensenellaceae bacterium]
MEDRDSRRLKIIQLQNEIIRNMTEKNLKSVGEDIWGSPNTPPPGYPKVPDVFSDVEGVEKEAEEQKKEEKPKEDIEDLKKELNEYIGLDTIKKEVDSLINLVSIYKLRKEHSLPCEDLSLHMVFTGNPGTGKTMIARLMSRIYHSLGILSKGHLVEVDRSGLVAGYVGQTAIKTSEVIEKALGGVLFIDEAYALTNRGMQDYGSEAVETLLKAMEDNREDLIVIVAGYTDLMKDFIESNPGLESRFNRYMHFPDYTVDEMMGIFKLRMKKAGYELDTQAEEPLRSLLEEKSKDIASFGNARGVRNLFEQAISRQANRLAGKESISREELMLLTKEDIIPEETKVADK